MGAIDKKEGKLHLLQAPKKVKGDSPKKKWKEFVSSSKIWNGSSNWK